MQDHPHHTRPAEAHQQACTPSAADDVAVLGPRGMTIVQVSEHCCFPTKGCHVWDKDMCWRRRIMPASKLMRLLVMQLVWPFINTIDKQDHAICFKHKLPPHLVEQECQFQQHANSKCSKQNKGAVCQMLLGLCCMTVKPKQSEQMFKVVCQCQSNDCSWGRLLPPVHLWV